MPKFAANLTMMFTEHAFANRFAAAAQAGFAAVECLFPYALEPEQLATLLRQHDLTLALFNMPPGDWAAGDRGIAVFPERRTEMREGLATALRYAEATGVGRLHLMAGRGSRQDAAAVSSYSDAVRLCAETVGARGMDLVLEPINTRSMPGYFLDDFAWTAALIDDLALPNLKLQFDIFHRQILHGDVVMALRRMMPMIGHVQVAGVPDRHEPDSGELNLRFLCDELDRLGFAGFVGCEYNPRGVTTDGLAWLRDLERRQ